jgi:hypothetical protein
MLTIAIYSRIILYNRELIWIPSFSVETFCFDATFLSMGISHSLSPDFVCGFSNRILSFILSMHGCWTKAMSQINAIRI